MTGCVEDAGVSEYAFCGHQATSRISCSIRTINKLEFIKQNMSARIVMYGAELKENERSEVDKK